MAQLNNANIDGNLRVRDYIKEGSQTLEKKFINKMESSTTEDGKLKINVLNVKGEIVSSVTLP